MVADHPPSFIRNELLKGEELCKIRYNRRAKEQLFEIKSRMEQVLCDYDISQEAYSILEKRGGKESERAERAEIEASQRQEHQTEILTKIGSYKTACKERQKVLGALEFFFSSYCEIEKQQQLLEETEELEHPLYHPDFSKDFDAAFVNASSALHRLKFLNAQIVGLAGDILKKKRKIEMSLRQRAGLSTSDELQVKDFLTELSAKGHQKVSLQVAEEEFERVLVELEARVAMNTRLKKYVDNQEEAVEVCQSMAKRLAVDNTKMLTTFSSSLKDVRTACLEIEKFCNTARDLQEKYEIPHSELNMNLDINKEILARNSKHFRELRKYERNVKEIELDFTRLEQLSKLLDVMKLQLHEASMRKDLTEEQLRSRLARLRCDVSEEIPSRASSRTRIREENGDTKKDKSVSGKKRKGVKKKGKKSTKSSTMSDVFSTTTIGDGTESIGSEHSQTDLSRLSPVSVASVDRPQSGGRLHPLMEGAPIIGAPIGGSTSNVRISSGDYDDVFVENEEPEGIVHSKTTIAASTISKTGAVSTDVKLDKLVLKKKVRTKSAKAMSVGSGLSSSKVSCRKTDSKRIMTPDTPGPVPVVTALESHSSPSINTPASDPILQLKRGSYGEHVSDTCLTRTDHDPRVSFEYMVTVPKVDRVPAAVM